MSTILIAFERESESSVLDELLTGRGHKVVRSGNGLEALEAARRDPPQLVVSDILLPKMDGFALCRKWKQDERLQSIPFIFFTTRYDDPKYERFAEELKADRFLARPSEPDALLNAVEELLAVAKARGTGTERLPVLNEANMRLSAQVTELQAQSRRLADGESNFRKLFEASPCPLWVKDLDTQRHVLVNEAALDLLGYSRPEFLGLPQDALEPSGEHPALPAGIRWRRRKDGQLLALIADVRPLDFGGRSAEVHAACDVTERIETTAALKSEVSLQRAVLDSAADGYCLVDAEGKLLDVNPAYCRLTGFGREELLKLSVADLELNAAGENTIRLHLERLGGSNRYESKHRRKSGGSIDVEVTVGNVDGQAGRRVMFIRDVSLQREELVRQRINQQRLAAVLELQQSADALDEPALIRRALEHSALITGSPLALALVVSPENKTVTLAGIFSATTGKAESVNAEARELGRDGVWAEVVKTRHVLLDNTVKSTVHPEGVPDLSRCLVVPLVEGEDVLLMIAVGNRESDYTEDDKRELTLLADGLWRIVKAKRSYSRTMSGLQRADVAMQSLIDTLSRIVETHDPHTAGSAARVAMLAVALGRELGMDGQKQHVLRIAGLLHDIGSVMVPAGVLGKPSRLTEQEMALVRAHPAEGQQMLASIDFNAPIAEIVYQHHERLDGSGYPRSLKGDDIMIEARILAVADVVEAMCSRRASRMALGVEAALAEINGNAGKLYDAHVAAACTRLFSQRGFALPE
jgi:PAS domain S-box-containing protein/putative nucleotidyltransferase with HDIG domain